jgi:DNA (cytosine-5)-methyltransferase 1
MTKQRTIRAADLFCGAGGTSSGLLDACADLGLKLNLLAINHWPIAIETHSANHPYAEHLCESLDTVDPRKVVPGGRLDLLVASPECTHHSNARGGKPMSDQSRASAWHVARWAEALHVSNILIENVREFRDWGPLDSKGRPIKKRKGELYGAFLNTLRAMGYNVEDRILNAADYGDPTSRKRLFIVARKGNRRVTWPEPSHSAKGVQTLFGRLPSYRTAREIINWESKGQSIFSRPKQLSPNTLRRIYAGLAKFSGLPFVMTTGQTGSADPHVRPVDEPLSTILSKAEHCLVEPFVIGQQSGAVPRSVDEPLPTVASAGAIALVQPFLVPYHRERAGQSARTHSVDEPIPTVATSPFGLVEPFLVSYHSEHDGEAARVHSVDAPLPAVPTENRYGLAEPFILTMRGGNDGYLRASSIDEPMPALTAIPPQYLVEPFIVQGEHTSRDPVSSVDAPMPGITSKAHFGLAQPYLVKYYGNGIGQPLDEPLGTVTGVERFGLCIPVGDGYAIVDILFRMLEPGELARAHSLDDYKFSGTKRDIVKQIGNSVPRRLAKALCLAALG